MKKIFYKDDFDFVLSVIDPDGKDLGWPQFDWRGRFWTTSKSNAYVAECIGGDCLNCFPDDNRLHILFDNHGLSFGDLSYEFTIFLPSDIYPDGSRKVTLCGMLPLRLTRSPKSGFSLDVEADGKDLPGVGPSSSIDADEIQIIVSRAIAQHNKQLKENIESGGISASDQEIADTASDIFCS